MNPFNMNQVNSVAVPQLVKPSMYKIVILNDDYTPLDFIAFTLTKFFHKSHQESTAIALQIHAQGSAICGCFTKDVAETKSALVQDYARKSQHPLKCVIEKI